MMLSVFLKTILENSFQKQKPNIPFNFLFQLLVQMIILKGSFFISISFYGIGVVLFFNFVRLIGMTIGWVL